VWRPFVAGEIKVHELACHHDAVLDPEPASRIGRIMRQFFEERLQTMPMPFPFPNPMGEGSAA
jgi:hypothetical protein